MLRPGTLDGDNHLLGRVDVDILAVGPECEKGAGVNAGWPVRQCPPLVAVSAGAARHQPAERGGRAVGLAGEIAPAGRQDTPATERSAILQHQLAEAADVAQARADA